VLLNEGTVAADDRRVKSVQMECLFQRRRCNGRVPKSYIRRVDLRGTAGVGVRCSAMFTG